MTWADFRQIILQLGIPVAYGTFKVTQSPPFLSYGQDGRSDLMADNIHYLKITDGYLELYTAQKDTTTENKIEEILTSHGFAWSWEYENFLDSENLVMVRWEFDFIGG